jgi:hypothetical protein
MLKEWVATSMLYGSTRRYIEVQKYSGEVNPGDCGTCILYGDTRASIVFGIVAAANVDFKSGAYIFITSNELYELEDSLNKKIVMPAYAYSGIHIPNSKNVDICSKPHPKNMVNYIPKEFANKIEYLGHVGKDVTLKGETKIHPYRDIFETKFNVPRVLPVPLHYRSMRQFMCLTAYQPAQLDSSILIKVNEVVYKTMTKVIDRYKEDKLPLFVDRPYTVGEAVNGIDCHPVAHGIATKTSAGFPWSKSKGKLMEGEPGSRVLNDEVMESIKEVITKWKNEEI